MNEAQTVRCYVYRSLRKADTYLYLKEEGDFEVIPDSLRQVFGEPQFALAFDLTPERTLAQENPAEVRANLAERGFHLQMPSENVDPF